MPEELMPEELIRVEPQVALRTIRFEPQAQAQAHRLTIRIVKEFLKPRVPSLQFCCVESLCLRLG